MYEATILFSFWFGDVVFLRVAEERRAGMVTGVTIRDGSIGYEVSWGDGEVTCHYAVELSCEYVPADWPVQGDEGQAA